MTLPTGPEGKPTSANPNPASPEVPKETTALTKSNPYGFPRRIQMEKWVPAERAIHEAVQIVEGMGADVRLTDAVCLLGAARVRVADFVDGVEGLRTLAVQQRTVEHHAFQQFLAFVGEGHVDFPRNLSELSEAVTLFECAQEDTADVR